jgi:energy-coupling factor transport system ATP-binding protein
MSWELASFLILGALLLAGFAWYERSRPPAQVVAMVAMLAALAIVLAGGLDGGRPPGLVALDEPTRGMDRARKNDLAELIARLADAGAGVVVATHDVEFAAGFADRVVLLGDGVVIADAGSGETLSGGWYFATEVARILDLPGVVTPEQGAARLGGEELT